MGQKNLIRTQFEARVTCTSPVNDDRQAVDFTGYFELGDVVDVIDVDAEDNIISVLADNLTILAIDTDVAVTLSAAVDTTAATGTPKIRVQEIDDGFTAIDRLYRKPRKAKQIFDRKEPIVESEINLPVAGKTILRMDDISFFKAGDVLDILDSNGIVASDVVIDSVSAQADDLSNKAYIVINSVVDTSASVSPFALNKSVTLQKAIERNRADLDYLDSPVENEDMTVLNGVTNTLDTCFETAALFVQNSTKLLIDGLRKKIGTPGTRASLVQGSGNSELTFKSMLMGVLGNEIEVQVQSGAGLTVAVTKTFKTDSKSILPSTQYLVVVNDNGGAATAQEIADAIQGDAQARRIIQAIYGGDGTGVVAAFGPTPLAGGLDDGSGDYAELEQVYRNDNTNTGFKFVSFHIRPNEQNRMNKPPVDDEEVVIDYRKANVNI